MLKAFIHNRDIPSTKWPVVLLTDKSFTKIQWELSSETKTIEKHKKLVVEASLVGKKIKSSCLRLLFTMGTCHPPSGQLYYLLTSRLPKYNGSFPVKRKLLKNTRSWLQKPALSERKSSPHVLGYYSQSGHAIHQVASCTIY